MKKLLLLLLCSLPFLGFGQDIIYSTNTDKELIRTDINGNSPIVLHTAPGDIKSVVMDNINNKVYWNEFINGSTGVSALMRSDINSFMPEVVLNVSTGEMNDIHLMKDTNLIYWRELGSGGIYNNANGYETLIINSNNILSFCIDENNGYIYTNSLYSISRYDLDGSNGVSIGSLGGNSAYSMVFDENNQKIYYLTGSQLYSYDISTNSNQMIISASTQSEVNLTLYNPSSPTPYIMWTGHTAGYIARVKSDGTGFQVVLIDDNTYGVDIIEKTGKLEGFVYMDLDSNGVYDNTTETPLGNQILELEKANGQVSYLTTRADGNYTFEVDTAQYTISYFTDTLWKETSNRTTYNIHVTPDTVISDLNFGIIPEYTKGDMTVDLTNSSFVCNNSVTLWLTVRNLGTETITGVNLDLWVNSASSIQSAGGGGTINGNYVSWNIPGDFYPFTYTGQEESFSVAVQAPGVGAMGNSIIDSARVTPLQPNLIEMDSTNNYSQVTNTVLCSYDPNDKLVFPVECFNTVQDTLDYTIRFQNTGNYPASKVRLVDTLDLEKLDIMSFEVLGASHDYEWSLRTPSVLEVIYNNINLVDSSVSFTESQGFFKYRILVRDSLPDMQPTTSAAYIYFDNNPPIVTNEPEVRFTSSLAAAVFSTNTSCFGSNDGTALLNIYSGTSPYDISWNSGNTTASINNLSTGVYSVTLTDAQNCSFTDSVSVTQPAAITSSNTQTVCNGQSISVGNNTYTTSGTYTDVLSSVNGCDSTVTTVLTVTTSSSLTVKTTCDSYTWLVNNQVYSTSGIFTITTNNSGCLHVDSLYLTIRNSTSSTTNHFTCNNYTWNGQTYTSSGTYNWLGTNAVGCDSSATLNLTLGSASSTSSNTTISTCNAYVWNGQTYNSSGTYSWIGLNSQGCDSTATLNLTITNSNTSSSTQSACDSYTWNGQTYTASGVFSYSTTNSSGCDSTAVLDLTINTSTTYTNTASICYGETFAVGFNNYNLSGVYYDVFTSANGCDSTVTTNLTVATQITAFIFQTGSSDITVNTLGGNTPYVYEWNTGETTQTITPAADGDYWVIVEDVNACVSDTFYYNVDWISTGISEIQLAGFSIYPNPSNDVFNIVFGSNTKQDIDLKIHNVLGEVIFTETLTDFSGDYNTAVDMTPYPNAIYILQLSTQDGTSTKKLALKK